MYLYMVVTSDKFELPVLVEDKLKQIAEWFNITPCHASCNLMRNTVMEKRFRIIKIEMENEDVQS